MKQFDEWYGSQSDADTAAVRVEKCGYRTNVRFAARSDGTGCGWLLEAFDPPAPAQP